MEKILDIIGYFAPYILFVFSIVLLWKRNQYFTGYIVFYFLNIIVNKILKVIIREPRPTGGKSILSFEDGIYEGIEKYGMPSGHLQSCFYSLTYLYLVKESPSWLLLETFIASASFYQRWSYNRHTVEQLSVGSLVGIFMGWFSYFMVHKYLITQ